MVGENNEDKIVNAVRFPPVRQAAASGKTCVLPYGKTIRALVSEFGPA